MNKSRLIISLFIVLIVLAVLFWLVGNMIGCGKTVSDQTEAASTTTTVVATTTSTILSASASTTVATTSTVIPTTTTTTVVTTTTNVPTTTTSTIATTTTTTATTTTVTFDANVGVTWAKAVESPIIDRTFHGAVVYNSKLWVMGGEYNGTLRDDVYSSSNGSDWSLVTTEADFSPRFNFGCISFEGFMWVIGGSDESGALNDVWYSSDGSTWLSKTQTNQFSARYGHACIVHDGKIWLLGGNDGSNQTSDVWYSSNGASWTKNASSFFSAREGAGAFVFNNKLWILGGYDPSVGYLGDVISYDSDDLGDAPIGRSYHQVLVHDNRIFVIGGRDTNDTYDDVWWSATGQSSDWHEAIANGSAPFNNRHGHAGVVFNDKICLYFSIVIPQPLDTTFLTIDKIPVTDKCSCTVPCFAVSMIAVVTEMEL